MPAKIGLRKPPEARIIASEGNTKRMVADPIMEITKSPKYPEPNTKPLNQLNGIKSSNLWLVSKYLVCRFTFLIGDSKKF